MNEQLVQAIRTMQIQGNTPEQIYAALLAQGFSINDIQQALNLANGASTSPVESKEKQRVNIVQIVSYIGAVLIAIGIFSFVAANWPDMPSTTKIITLMTLLMLSYAAAYICETNQMKKTAGAFYLLGSLVYGASIFLIAQIFNIRGNWAEGFLYWMIGLIPLALITGRNAVWGICIIVGIIAAAGYPFGFEMLWRYPDPQMFLSLPVLLLGVTIPALTGIIIRAKVKKQYQEFF